jgi:hypothetical protein
MRRFSATIAVDVRVSGPKRSARACYPTSQALSSVVPPKADSHAHVPGKHSVKGVLRKKPEISRFLAQTMHLIVGQDDFKEKAMEAQTGYQSNFSRLRNLPRGKPEIQCCRLAPEAEPNIICQYGVVVQQTSVAGMELVEFEFLPDAA